MIAVRFALAIGALSISACGGRASTTATTGTETLPSVEAESDATSAPAETLPALVDASTDIEAIERPVVLWFWSPG